MKFIELARQRFSVRNYLSKPIEREKLEYVLEAARIAPSACNIQPWHFIVAEEETIRKRVASSYGGRWIDSAPAIIVACGNHSQAWKRRDCKDHTDVDISIAVDHMTLAAAEIGLGTCWVCALDPVKCKEVLGLPEELEPIALIPIGYPDQQTDTTRHTSARKNLDDIVSWNGFKG